MIRIKALTVLVTMCLPYFAEAADKLIIISPHRKSLQNEFLPRFKEDYKKRYNTTVNVEWLDQGGTSDDVRFVAAKFASKKTTSGVDVFWGGGSGTFQELNRDGYLADYTLPKELDKQLPATIAGVPMRDSQGKRWFGSAASSFGIFYNKKLAKMLKLPEPASWDHLAAPQYFNQVTLADPRRSGTANTMNTIILQGRGWDKGWQLLTAIAGNTRQYTHSSSDPIKAVVAGASTSAMAIDFYAAAKIQDLGKDKLGYVLPEGQTVLDPDPVAILRGAPHRKPAERFVQFVLSAQAQQLLVLPKGSPGGPSQGVLGRMSPNKEVYTKVGDRAITLNPFEMKKTIDYDSAAAGRLKRVFDDLIGAVLIDTHRELKRAWQAHIKRGGTIANMGALGVPPVTEAEAYKLAEQWEDNVFRNKTINSWVKKTRQKYKNASLGH